MGYSVINDNNITTYISSEGNDVSQPLNVSIGVGTYQRRVPLFVGNMETKYGNTNNNYNKGDTILNYNADNDWIKIGKDPENTNLTAAAIVYTSQKNESDDERQVELTLSGNSDNKITIIQKPMVHLMYMVKNTNEQYGDWIECIKINKGSTVFYDHSPLTSVKDISIFNGKSNNTTYNDITIEIQPYRSMNIVFAFSPDDTLDRIITSQYSMEIVNDSSFILNETYNSETGYFSFSTNDHTSWTKKSGFSNIGPVVDVSAHYIIKPNDGINLPNINFYISNELNYRIIDSFNIKIKCEQGGECFIKTIGIDADSEQDWPTTTGSSIIIENCTSGQILHYTHSPVEFPTYDGFSINRLSLKNMVYSISIEGFTYTDYDGTQKHSGSTLSTRIYTDTTILSIDKHCYDSTYAIMSFVSKTSTNKQTFVDVVWPPNVSEPNNGWAIHHGGDMGQSGIYFEITGKGWRFRNSGNASKYISIAFML